MAQSITLDIQTLTLGELAEAERQSGLSFQVLIKGRANLILLALFVHELRSSENARSWQELSNLTLRDASSSIQRSPSDGPPVKSNA
jgi:hypothetical protein